MTAMRGAGRDFLLEEQLAGHPGAAGETTAISVSTERPQVCTDISLRAQTPPDQGVRMHT